MIKESHEKVTPYQSYVLLLMTIIGTGVLFLPRKLAEKAGNDGIWIIIIPCLLTWLLVYLITKLCQRFPRESVVEFSQEILEPKGFKWVGTALKISVLVAYVISWLITLALVTRYFGELLVSTILRETPMEVINFTFLIFAMVIAGSKIELVAKFNELLYPLLFIPILFFIVSIIQKGDLTNILPLFEISWSRMLEVIFRSVYDITGFNVILIFMAYYQSTKKAVKTHSYAMIFVTAFYFLTVITSYSVFGTEAASKMLWPTIETIRPLEFPIQLFERIESGIIVIWLVASFTTVVNIFAAFIDLFMRSCQIKEENRKWMATLLLLPIYIISMLPEGGFQLYNITPKLGVYIISVDIVIPILLLSIATWRKKKGGQNHEEATPS